VESALKRAGQPDEEIIPRKLVKMQNKSHMPKLDEYAEEELPEVLRKAADHDLEAMKKAKARRAEGKVIQNKSKEQKKIANPKVAETMAKQPLRPVMTPLTEPEAHGSAPQQLDAAVNKTVAASQKAISQPASEDQKVEAKKASAAASAKELDELTKKKIAAMTKEQTYQKKAAAAEQAAHEAEAEAMVAMKNASQASLQATKWHDAATKEHMFFEKAEKAENAALDTIQAQAKLDAAQSEVAMKALKKKSTATDLLSATRTASDSEKAAFDAESSQEFVGLSLNTDTDMAKNHDDVQLASYEQPSQVREDWADWAW